MDDVILAKLAEKITESDSHMGEINDLADSVACGMYDRDSVAAGIIAGRLYNAFYYQTRRTLNRNPTSGEFTEFLKFINDNVKKYRSR